MRPCDPLQPCNRSGLRLFLPEIEPTASGSVNAQTLVQSGLATHPSGRLGSRDHARFGPGGGRQAMQHCATRVLSGLARQRASENQVGSAVLTRCDGPLRAALTDAIQSGEAPNCTVESCLDMARSRAAAEAIQAYRQHGQR
jgi:hypothetical protein